MATSSAPFRLLALLAVFAAAPAAAEPRQPLAAFDVSQAPGWAEALAICDLTRFLVLETDLDADVILTPDDRTGWLRPLYGPRFIPPNLIFDGAVKAAYHRLERA